MDEDDDSKDNSVNKSKRVKSFSISHHSHAGSNVAIDEASTMEILTADSFKKQFCFFIQMALPSAAGYAIGNILEFINLLFLGKQGDELLIGACGLGNCWIFIMVISLPAGLGSAIDTLCSQAYGAKDYRKLGACFNRGFVIVNIALIPLLMVSWEVGNIFRFCGYDAVLADHISEYVRYQFPAIILQVYTLLIVKFLQSQRIYNIQFYISVLAAGVHTVSCFIFVNILKYKLKGASVALDIAALVEFLAFYGYVKFSDRFGLSWLPFDYQAFTKWKEFFAIAIPNSIMIIPEYFGLFVLGFEAGYLSKSELAAHSIITNFLNFVYGIAYGFTVCAGALAGNSIGESRPDLTARVPFATFKCYYVCLGITMLIMMALRLPILHLFTHDENVLKYAIGLFPLVISTQLTDGCQGILNGILRGVGKTFTAAIGNVIAYIVILHPVAILLAFVAKLGVYGLWIGWFVGTGCSASFYWLVWKSLDLKAISQEIRDKDQDQILDNIVLSQPLEDK